MSITSKKPYKIFDAAAAGHPLAVEVFKQLPDSDGEGGEKLFATTNDWCVSQPDTIFSAQANQFILDVVGARSAISKAEKPTRSPSDPSAAPRPKN